jgi:amidase
MKETAYKSATALLADLQAGRATAVELLEMYIDRVNRLNPKINAVVATDLENARKRARDADKATKNGETWGRLHGLPITIKDSFEVTGMPCTSGSPDLKNYMPEKNADVVQALINEGAIVFGKTNLPLFAMDFQSYNDVHGQTGNPWDTAKIPGGSSGGAAAAVAAGLTGLEIGSDIGGSIRNPSHFCGVYGHKPTYGVVPLRGHIPPPPGIYPGEYAGTSDIAVAGPISRNPKDLGLAMEIIAGSSTVEQPAWQLTLPPSAKKRLEDYRIGLWLDDPAYNTDTQVLDRLQYVVDRLAASGARIEDKRPDIDLFQNQKIYHALLAAETSAGLPEEVLSQMKSEKKKLGMTDDSHYARNIRGSLQSHREWIMADYRRMLMRQKWADYFRDIDLLLCPVVSVTAFDHDHSEFFSRTLTVNGIEKSYFDALIPWAGLIGVVYLPSTVVPVGTAQNGLPVGMQIVGPYLGDLTCIHFAELMEDVVGGFVPPPGFET